MKPHSILTISLLAVSLLGACAPATASQTALPEITVQPALNASETPALPPSATAIQPQAAQTEAQPTLAPTEAPQAIATSRGPDLESTDPATVSLASGELQLVEFFRYT